MVSFQLKPQFFVTRQNGAMVPLIAMDELPIHVQIQGVSRMLSAFEVAGMTGVGARDARHEFYIVESMNNMKPIPFMPLKPITAANSVSSAPIMQKTDLPSSLDGKAPLVDLLDYEINKSLTSPSISYASVEQEGKTTRSTSPEMIAPAKPIVDTPAPTATTTLAWRNNSTITTTPAPNTAFIDKRYPEVDWNPETPAAGQKIYCSHWLKYGECSFTQTGCLFKHVMPLKLEVLEALGLRDLPDWFRKTVSCGSLRVNNGRNGLSFGITPNNVAIVDVEKIGAGPRTRVDQEASRRAIAAHINAMPMHGSRPVRNHHCTNTNKPVRNMNPRLGFLGASRPRMTDAERAAERDRHDKRLAAAFEADLESNACTDMMDAEMERIREREQAGWEAEQKARQAAADAANPKAGKKGVASSSDASDKDAKKGASADKGKTRAGHPRRKQPVRKVLKE